MPPALLYCFLKNTGNYKSPLQAFTIDIQKLEIKRIVLELQVYSLHNQCFVWHCFFKVFGRLF